MKARSASEGQNDSDPLEGVIAVKNIAELAVLAGLFSYIGKNFDSDAATIVSWVLKAGLGVMLGITVQKFAFLLFSPKPGDKNYKTTFIVSGGLGLVLLIAIHVFLMVPVLGAIERQQSATPPAPQLQASPARAGIQAQPSAGTAAPKPAAAPSAEATAAPAPSVLPSAAPTRSSSPEERKPD